LKKVRDRKQASDKLITLKEVVQNLVHNESSLTFGGFCGRNSQATAYEIIRQKKRGLVFIDDSPTDQLDMLIGAGCVSRVEIAWHGISIFAPARNFRRAVEEQIPQPIEVEDYSNYAAGLRFMARAMNVPFLPTRSLLGSDIPKHNDKIKIIKDPYEGEPIALVPAASPDVAIIHVQRADKQGNAQIWGHLANDENKARAAIHTVVTCEELVRQEAILKIPNMTILPSYCVDAVVEVPYGSHPWSCYGYYYHDIIFQRDYAKNNETRPGFLKWLKEWVLSCDDQNEYCKKVGKERLRRLTKIERSINKIPV
jgi:glutaconate CoA-transferase subunit A